MQPPKFSFTVCLVTIAHILAIATIVIGGVSSCIAKKNEPKILPVEFMVAVDDGPEMKDFKNIVDNPPPEEIRKPDPKPESKPIKTIIPEKKKPEPEKKIEKKKESEKKKAEKQPEKKKEPPKKQPEKKTFVKGKRITAPNSNPPPPNMKRLSPEELSRLLAMGATAGNKNLVPEGDTLYYEVIRRRLYKAWVQPGSVSSRLSTEIEITMNTSGEILNRRLLRPSGNRTMDDSVMEAVKSVPRIEGLSSDFLERKRGRVTITFELSSGAA